MALFDFISDEDFRLSLESDYQEIEKCLETGAWKAVYVLSGSIIEALLLDYLTITEYEKRTGRKLKDLMLHSMIKVCEEEKVLSERTAGISNVIKDYRNLIHPQRIKRLEEKIDGEGASVTFALVKMIIKDIAEKKSEKVGITSKQLMEKLKNDSSFMSIFDHIIQKMSNYEKKRFLLRVAENYLYLREDEYSEEYGYNHKISKILENLIECFHIIFKSLPDNTKQEIMKEFTRVIKEENEEVIRVYEEKLFKSTYFAYFATEEQPLFKKHFLARLRTINSDIRLIEASKGIAQHLDEEEGEDFIDAFIFYIIREKTERYKQYAIDVLATEFAEMNKNTQEKTDQRLRYWKDEFTLGGENAKVDVMEQIEMAISIEFDHRAMNAEIDLHSNPFKDDFRPGLIFNTGTPPVPNADFNPLLDSVESP